MRSVWLALREIIMAPRINWNNHEQIERIFEENGYIVECHDPLEIQRKYDPSSCASGSCAKDLYDYLMFLEDSK